MKKITVAGIILIVVATPIILIYFTFKSSKECNQLVIDTYELHSGIDIPEVVAVNCYFDKKLNTRISIYDLNAHIDLSNFIYTKCTSQAELLYGVTLLNEMERPANSKIYLASGERWGTKWTYVVDNEARRLWAELKYEN